MELAETLVNLSDKELLKIFNTTQIDLKENQVASSEKTLYNTLDAADKQNSLKETKPKITQPTLAYKRHIP